MASSPWLRPALMMLIVALLPSLLQATFSNMFDKKEGKGGGYSYPVVYMMPALYAGGHGYGTPARGYGAGLNGYGLGGHGLSGLGYIPSGLGSYGLGGNGLSGLGGYIPSGLGSYGLGGHGLSGLGGYIPSGLGSYGLGGHGLSGLGGYIPSGLGSYGLGGHGLSGLGGYIPSGLGSYGLGGHGLSGLGGYIPSGLGSYGHGSLGNLNSNPHGPLGSYNNGYGSSSSVVSGPYHGHSDYPSSSGYGSGRLYTHLPAYKAAAKSDAKHADHKLVVVKELYTGGSEHDKGVNLKLQDEGYSHPFAHSDQSFVQYPKMLSDQPHHLYKIKEFEFDKGYNGHGIGFHKMIEYDLRSAQPQTSIHNSPSNVQHPHALQAGGSHRNFMKRSVNSYEYTKLPLVMKESNDSLIHHAFSNKTTNERKSRGLYIPPFIPMLPPPRPILPPPMPVFIPYYKPIIHHPYPRPVYRTPMRPRYQASMRPINHPIGRQMAPKYRVQTIYPSNQPFRPPTTVGFYRYRRDVESQHIPADTVNPVNQLPKPSQEISHHPPHQAHVHSSSPIKYHYYAKSAEAEAMPHPQYHQYGYKPSPHPVQVHVSNPPPPPHKYYPHLPPNPVQVHASAPHPPPEKYHHFAKSAEAEAIPHPQYHQYGYKPSPNPVQVHVSNPPPPPHKYYSHLPPNPVQVHVSAPHPPPEKYHHFAKSAEAEAMPHPQYHQYGYKPAPPPSSPVYVHVIPPPHHPPPLPSSYHYAKSSESQYQQQGNVYHRGQGHYGHP